MIHDLASIQITGASTDGSSTASYEGAGFPWRFWTRSPSYGSFRELRFASDLAVALYCSYKAGRWYEQRRTKKMSNQRGAEEEPIRI